MVERSPAVQHTANAAMAVWRLPSLWGDGFAEDGFAALASVDSWDGVCADEYVRLFPRLVGQMSTDVIKRLEFNLQSTIAKEERSEGSFACQAEALKDLIDLLHEGTPPTFDASLADAVAYQGAVHPAYAWPEAAVAHQRYSALGWLGIVMRGRPALMPIDVAEYLVDAIEAGGTFAAQEALRTRVTCQRAADQLRRKAMLRISGRRVVVWPDDLRHHPRNLLHRMWKRRFS